MYKVIRLMCIAILLGLLIVSSTEAQTTVSKILVTAINSNEFPQIYVRFRALDNNGDPVPNVAVSMLAANEDDREAALESIRQVEQGVWVQFVVDAGAGISNTGRWDSARNAILRFLQNQPGMVSGVDRVAVQLIRSDRVEQLVDFTTNTDDIVRVLESYSLSVNPEQYSAPYPALDEALEDLRNLPDTTNQPKFIVFMTSGIESTGRVTPSELTEKAREYGIPVYAIFLRSVARLGDGGLDQPVADLATNSGGEYFTITNSLSLNQAYERIKDHSLSYEVTYRSTSAVSGTRQVRMTTQGAGIQAAATAHTYNIEVNPLRILIEQPSAGAVINRESPAYTQDAGSVEPTTQSVVAQVVFPDNPLRLLSATLQVNGADAGRISNPPNPLEFSWNLRNITERGTTDYSLRVLVEDEFGRITESQPINASVNLIIPEQETLDVTRIVTEIIEVLPPPPTPIPCVLPDALCSVERQVRSNPTSYASLLVAALSLVFAGIVYVNRDKAPVLAARQNITNIVTRITKRITSEPIAYLVVEAGDHSGTLEIYGDTAIGRSKKDGATLLFQQQDEDSPISRLHCKIFNEEDHFMLRDEDSANGTFLNSNKLEPLKSVPLNDGDFIDVAPLQRGGVRLRFQLVASGDNDPEVNRDTRRAHTSTKPQGDRF